MADGADAAAGLLGQLGCCSAAIMIISPARRDCQQLQEFGPLLLTEESLGENEADQTTGNPGATGQANWHGHG